MPFVHYTWTVPATGTYTAYILTSTGDSYTHITGHMLKVPSVGQPFPPGENMTFSSPLRPCVDPNEGGFKYVYHIAEPNGAECYYSCWSTSRPGAIANFMRFDVTAGEVYTFFMARYNGAGPVALKIDNLLERDLSSEANFERPSTDPPYICSDQLTSQWTTHTFTATQFVYFAVPNTLNPANRIF